MKSIPELQELLKKEIASRNLYERPHYHVVTRPSPFRAFDITVVSSAYFN